VLALTRRGEAVAEAWRPIPDEIERRWLERFGAEPIDRLRAALVALVAADGRRLPDYMPIGSVYGVGIDPPPPGDDPDRVPELPLVSLLSRALLAFALDYEQRARLSLAVFLDGLRVIDGDGVPLRELPARAGVSKEAIAMIVKRLESAGCIVVEPIPGARRGQQARLTSDGGAKAKRAGARRCERILDGWRGRYGGDAVSAVGDALAPIVGDGTSSGSALFGGLQPPAGGWRAEVPPPERLPWFPMVLHRGGYPDGS
jgi:DNA-binding MarR family transcriptional regulator